MKVAFVAAMLATASAAPPVLQPEASPLALQPDPSSSEETVSEAMPGLEPSPLPANESAILDFDGLESADSLDFPMYGESNETQPWLAPELDLKSDPQHLYTRTYTSYICVGKHLVRGCAAGKAAHYDVLLHREIERLPHGFHLLVYGPSWIRQLADAIIRHAHSHGSGVRMQIHGEGFPAWKKPCYCTLLGVKCPCADFATYHLGIKGGARLTTIVNFKLLQERQHMHRLRRVLRGARVGSPFTHALAMEPHLACFFREDCPAVTSKGMKVPSETGGTYGCGWSNDLWTTLRSHFPANRILHVVPWYVPAEFPVTRPPGRIQRTKKLVEDGHSCETGLHVGHEQTWSPYAQPISPPSASHQCAAICHDKQHMASCHNGSPTLLAYEALTKI